MGWKRNTWLAAASISFVAVAAHAQDASPSAATTSSLGETTSGIVSLENVFGFAETTETIHDDTFNRDVSRSYDDKGFFPGYLGPRVGLHGVSGHVTYGAVFGMWWAKPIGRGSDDSGSIYTTFISPRIGYVGTIPKQPVIGYWIRTGPTVLYAHTESGGTGGTSRNAGSFDWGIDAFGIIRPVEHFAILVGPSFDIAIYGRASDTNDKLGIVSVGIGLMADW